MSQTEVSDAVTSQIDQVVIWHSFEFLYALISGLASGEEEDSPQTPFLSFI